MPSPETVFLELQLKEARERERTEQRAQQVQQLKAVRSELRARTMEYDALARKLSKAVDDKVDLELEINHWRAALSALEQQAPREIKIKELSDDPDEIRSHPEDHPDYKALNNAILFVGNVGTVGKTITATFTGTFTSRFRKPKLILTLSAVDSLDVHLTAP